MSESAQSFEDQVKDVIEEIRPAIQSHGGDIEFVGATEDNAVQVRLKGACHGCPGAMQTLKWGVERFLKERVPEVKEVLQVQ